VADVSSFIVIGRGGAPAEPGGWSVDEVFFGDFAEDRAEAACTALVLLLPRA
jgi:hypothetical protein